MRKSPSLAKNVFYNFVYTSLNLLFPLITAPYVSRVLGASNLGLVNFATVIINWFVLFSTFGTTTYGIREVAKFRHERPKLNKFFSEIIVIKSILTLSVTILYFILVLQIDHFYIELPLYLIMSLNLIFNMFQIDWLFQGMENYRYITIRNLVIKILSLICIFLFIRNPSDYVLYGLISVIATGLNGIFNFMYSKRIVDFQLKGINPTKHLRKLLVFFFNTLIINIYTSLDQVFLGFFVDSKSVAFINRSKMIINLGISLSTAITNVLLSRASYNYEKDKRKYYDILKQTPRYILWVTVPITFGCIYFAPNIMYILGGSEFLDATMLLRILSITMLLAPLATYLSNQVLIVSGNEKLGMYCSILTSFLSLAINAILIPKYGALGASITQLISENISLWTRYFLAKHKLRLNEVSFNNKSINSFFIAGFIMILFVHLIVSNIQDYLVSFLAGIVSGVLIYILVLILFKEEITARFLKRLLKMFR